jgi:hypothetical protein
LILNIILLLLNLAYSLLYMLCNKAFIKIKQGIKQ